MDIMYLAVNEAVARLTGWRGVMRKKVFEVIADIRESDPELLEIYERVAMPGKPEHFERLVKAICKLWSIIILRQKSEPIVAVFGCRHGTQAIGAEALPCAYRSSGRKRFHCGSLNRSPVIFQ
jgi:hypothetical protein